MQRKTKEEEANTEEYTFPYVEVTERAEDPSDLLNRISERIGTEYEDELISCFPVSSTSLDEQSWKFIPDEDARIIQSIKEGAQPNLEFADPFDRIEKGYSSGELSVYLVTDEVIQEHDLEEDIIYPVLEGEDIRRWREPKPRKKIIYANPNYNINEYPNIKNYLEQFRDTLEDRTDIDNWWGLRRYRPGAVTDEKKIITPKVAYYNNFTFLQDAHPVDTIYYGVPKDENDYNFLLGLANSVVMQFYMRMEGTPYRGSYLMYYGSDWGSLPLARDNDSNIEDAIADKTEEILKFIEELEETDEILQNPTHIYDNFEVETLQLTEHPAVKSFNLDPVEIDDPIADGAKITFQNLEAEITFFDDQTEYQELLLEILNIKNFEMADELKKISLPIDDSVVPTLIDQFQTVHTEVETASEDMRELQNELDELVLDLYEFDEETRELIKERTPTPRNPLDTRVVVTE